MTIQHKRRLAAVAFVAATTMLATAGCASDGGGGNGSGQLTTVRIGIAPYQDLFAMYIGIENGWYEDEGIDVQLNSMDLDASAEALAGGSVDMASMCDAGMLVGFPQNPDLRFTNPTHIFVGSAILARKDSTLKTYDDFIAEGDSPVEAVEHAGAQLDGLTAIATHNSDQELAIITAAQKGDVDPAGITFIDLNADDGLAAFLSGEGDVYNGGLPQRARALEEGAKVILSGSELAPEGVIECGFVSTASYLESNLDTLTKMQDVWYRIMQEIESNPEASYETITSELQSQTGQVVGVDDMKALWNKLEFFPSTDAEMASQLLDSAGQYYWENRFSYATEYYQTAGTIKGDVDLDELFAYDDVHENYVTLIGEK